MTDTSVLATALKSCTLPAAITLISALSALALTISKNVESLLAHFAGGVVLSACANELLPMVSGHDVPVGALSGGFLAGMLLMMGIRKAFPEDDDDDDDDDAKDAGFKALPGGAPAGDGAIPWGTVVPMFIDFIMDGILIGLSFAAGASSEDGDSSSAGLIMVISLSVEKITLGSSTTFAMKKKGVSTFKALTVVTILAVSMYLGAAFGVIVVAALKGSSIFYSAISFGIAALLWLVIEELLEEAHETKDTTITPVAFFLGFLIPMVLDKLG